MCICTIRLLYNVIRIRDIYSIEYVLRIHSIYLLDSMFDTLCTLERAHTHTHVVRYVDRRIFNVMIMPFVYRTHQHWHDGCVYAGKRPRHSRYQPLNASIGCIYTIIVCVVEARVHWIMARIAGTAYTHTLAITFFFLSYPFWKPISWAGELKWSFFLVTFCCCCSPHFFFLLPLLLLF